jgi:hypothetical protein
VVEEWFGDVAEDHPASIGDMVKRGEGDQASPGPNIKERVALTDPRVSQHSIADRYQVSEVCSFFL